ncbi:uncharacterized protein LOC119070020 [Bradysia coprophila]|uniref:uncharacterized protein LOC119070020 n=1 Tax=Bradysia coprophila TaxID=38358 RepID=UPI00187D92BF|nr:uncharacterized protein LOC119070020 [Bradysia coprophila]
MSALEFLDKMMSMTLSQISNISNRSSNVLDLVFVNEPNDFSICEDRNTIIEKEQQDPSHKPYEINVDYSCNVEVKTIYCYNNGHYDRRDKLFKRKCNGALTLEYEIALKDFNKLNDRLQHDHLIRIQENIKNDPAAFWKFARINGGIDAYPNQMSYGDRVGRTTNEIVDLFAEYFESIYVNDEEPWEFDDAFVASSDSVDIEVYLFDVENAIKSLKLSSGAGPDEIKPRSTRAKYRLQLRYRELYTGTKRKGDRAEVKNYRVVAIQPIAMKVQEMAVKCKTGLVVQPRLSDVQHGFRYKRFIVTNLLNLSVLAYDAIERRCQVDLFYGDFKAAFDKVWIRKLIIKFASFGVGKKTTRWIWQYLVGRTNYVQIEIEKSRIFESPSGVPPKSSLGLLAFTVFIEYQGR